MFAAVREFEPAEALMTSDAIRQTRLLTGYRYCEEDFQPGHVEKATSDHLPDLSPDKQKAEIAIRQGDK